MLTFVAWLKFFCPYHQAMCNAILLNRIRSLHWCSKHDNASDRTRDSRNWCRRLSHRRSNYHIRLELTGGGQLHEFRVDGFIRNRILDRVRRNSFFRRVSSAENTRHIQTYYWRRSRQCIVQMDICSQSAYNCLIVDPHGFPHSPYSSSSSAFSTPEGPLPPICVAILRPVKRVP